MSLSRRSFLQQLAAGAAAAPFLSHRLQAQAPAAPEARVNHASFGSAGMAWADISALATHPALNVVAVCEVDLSRTGDFRKRFPEARVYQDFRELLDKEKDLQSVNVSTPDHLHAPIAMAAMQRGLHVYGQKPLTHDLYECRRLAEVAAEKKLVTQMGIQIHSSSEYRTAVQLVRAGAIGKVKETHSWSGSVWGDLGPLPDHADPVPPEMNWDLWLGGCTERPFYGNGWYHPMNWRKRVDFGTGTLGDMACHIFDPVFGALALTAPISVRSEGAPPSEHSWAIDAEMHYIFPGTEFTEGPTIPVSWYNGAQRPPQEIQQLALDPAAAPDSEAAKLPSQGTIFIGTKGVMLLPHIGKPRLLGEAKDWTVVMAKGADHWHDYIDAILGKAPTTADFSYAGPLTEAVLIGSVAARFPKTTLNWEAAGLKFTNVPEANHFIRRTYREGFGIPGLV